MKKNYQLELHFHIKSKDESKMKPYLQKKRITYSDLQQIPISTEKACEFLLEKFSVIAEILFCHTKKQAQDAAKDEALRWEDFTLIKDGQADY